LLSFAHYRPALVLLFLLLFCDIDLSVSLRSFDIGGLVQSKKKERVARRHRSVKSRHHKKPTDASVTNEPKKPNISEMNKVGSSTTDLRKLSPAPPEKKERPQRPDPKINRKIYPKPSVIKHD